MSAVIASANRQPSIGERGPPSRRIELWIASEYHSPHDTMTTTHRSTIWWRWEMVVTMHNCLRGEGKAKAFIHSKCKHKWMNSDSRFKRCGKGIKSKFACLLLLHDAMKTGASRSLLFFLFAITQTASGPTHTVCVYYTTHTFTFKNLSLLLLPRCVCLFLFSSSCWTLCRRRRDYRRLHHVCLFVCLPASRGQLFLYALNTSSWRVASSKLGKSGKKWEDDDIMKWCDIMR